MRTIVHEKRAGHDSSNAGRVASRTSVESSVEASSREIPLVVDLDGTLLRTDLLHESVIRLIKQEPWNLLALLVWLLRGRKYFKRRVFSEVRLDTTVLPVNEEVLGWLREEKDRGRKLFLATASDQNLAQETIESLNLFDSVLGSTATRDLKGAEKAVAIKETCGAKFDYVGNSRADLAVWRLSREAILVNAGESVERVARRTANVTRVISSQRNALRASIKPLRLYQWVKNLLIFVPAFTSHQWLNGPILLKSAIAFLAFGLCASGTYIANDLLDL